MGDKKFLQPTGVRYPIWAWYRWEGKRKRMDMRKSGHAQRGEKVVQLTIEVEDEKVLLSDFDLFHYILRYDYLPLNEKDGERFDKEYEKTGYEWKDPADFRIQTNTMKNLRSKIIRSWERIFLLDKEDNGFIYGLNSKKSIQATFWELKLDQVVKAEVFIAK